MMFKWPGTPSARAHDNELADFAELQAWRNSSVSATDLSRLLGRIDENDYPNGVPEEDEIDEIVGDAYVETERRLTMCRNGYPFTTDERGHILRVRQGFEYVKHIIYKYLLLATRLNMRDNKIHSGIDGTLIFEELAAEVARTYLGARAQCFIFGTADHQFSFQERINRLCLQLREGGGFENRGAAHLRAQDGKLDIVAWKPFTDGFPGQLIAFGQCKTGTNYKDTLAQLQPDAFCKKWLQDQPALMPVRALFVAEALPRSERSDWYDTAADSGLLFDRCRIVDFCDDISDSTLSKVITWTTAAAVATGLPAPSARQ